MTNLLPILFFLTWRLIDNWVIYLSSKIIPYLGFFPYLRELYDFGVNQTTQALANFDGIHYLLIAHRGAYEQWEQAFFPLYPLLIRMFNFIFHNELITAFFISNISFFIGLWFLIKYLKLISDDFHPFQLIVFILVFPTSFFFGAVYTEGLFFLLFILTLYFLKKKKYWLTILFSILASLTRLIGVFFVIPIAFHLFKEYQKSYLPKERQKIKNQNYLLNRKNLLLIAPLIGLTIYCIYLYKTTGDPLMFLTSQPAFGANRSTNIILLPQVIWRYLKIFFTASHNYQYYISLFEFIIFIVFFFVLTLDFFNNLKIKNFDRLALNLFSFANLLLPTLTGTFSSIPRYVLFSLSFFLYLSEIKNSWLRTIILLIFFLLHTVILGLFSQGYFIG